MNLTIDKANIITAYEDGSDSVKKTLRALFPTLFPWRKLKTDELKVYLDDHCGKGIDIHVSYKNRDIGFIWFGGNVFHPNEEEDKVFKVEKSAETFYECKEDVHGFVFYTSLE